MAIGAGHLADTDRRARIVEEARRRVAQGDLISRQLEVHGRQPTDSLVSEPDVCVMLTRAMDLTTTPAQERLRDQLREWLHGHLPWEYGVGLPPRFDDLGDEVAFGRRWQADLAGAGWVAVTWPAAYGGRDLGPPENFVVQEELARGRGPELGGRLGGRPAGA